MQTKKLLLAGSHAGSTAIAVIEEINKRNLDWEIHWVGMEYKSFKDMNVIFHNLNSGKIENKFTKNTVKSFLRIPLSIIRGRKIIKEINPDLILSFGSAAGAISAFWANYIGKTVLIHEQTATAGRANIISSYFAKKILISRESSLPFFNKKKTEIVGNPLNGKIIEFMNRERSARIKSILITGGSRGSTWINNAIKPILSKLLEKYYIIHQTGVGKMEEFRDIKNDKQSLLFQSKYFAFENVSPQNMAKVLSKSDIVIGRSGANTCWELLALKKPCILIPIPWTYNDEATENAKYLEKTGLARIILQKELTPQRLFAEIEILINEYPSIIKKTENLKSPDLNATANVVDILEDSI